MDNPLNIQENSFLGSGWAFPINFSYGNYQLGTSAGEENINESINIILGTRLGERCYQQQFGSGLQQFVFRKMDETLKGEITDMVKDSLLFNEPRITVNDVAVNFLNPLNGYAEITVNYTINNANTRHNHVYPFHLKEGTNL